MAQNEILDRLIQILCEERGEAVPLISDEQKPDLFRALCNVRPPMPVTKEFLLLQDEYLSQRTKERGIVDANGFVYRDGIALWRGDNERALTYARLVKDATNSDGSPKVNFTTPDMSVTDYTVTDRTHYTEHIFGIKNED